MCVSACQREKKCGMGFLLFFRFPFVFFGRYDFAYYVLYDLDRGKNRLGKESGGFIANGSVKRGSHASRIKFCHANIFVEHVKLFEFGQTLSVFFP